MPVLLASSPHYSTTAETPGRTVKVRKEKKKKKNNQLQHKWAESKLLVSR